MAPFFLSLQIMIIIVMIITYHLVRPMAVLKEMQLEAPSARQLERLQVSSRLEPKLLSKAVAQQCEPSEYWHWQTSQATARPLMVRTAKAILAKETMLEVFVWDMVVVSEYDERLQGL